MMGGEQNYILLETLLKQDPVVISHIRVENNITFFNVNGQEFCTAAGRVFHKNHSMYNSGLMHAIAEEEHDPKAIIMKELREEIGREKDEWWDKNKLQAYKAMISNGVEILQEQGEEQMEKFIERYFNVFPGEECREFINKNNG